MSKHNYSKYSTTNKINNTEIGDVVSFETPEIIEEVETSMTGATVLEKPTIELDPVTIDIVAEIDGVAEPVVIAETVDGIVVNCAKLNVRAKPNTTATPVCILEAGSEIEINVSKSTDEWFNVCTAAGIEGYCMRKFINANL